MVKTLVVDDDDDIADLLATLLERAGHSVTTAADGVAALDLLINEDFDLAVIDLQLPRFSGLEVVAAATKIPGGPRFIVISGQPWMHLERPDRVDRFVAKPFDFRSFLMIVEDVLEGPGLTLSLFGPSPVGLRLVAADPADEAVLDPSIVD